MSGLIMGYGGKYATYDEVCSVPVPAQTDTYTPLPNQVLVEMTKKLILERMPGYEVGSEHFGLSKNRQRFFGFVALRDGKTNGIGPAIGLRNGYDRQLSAAMCGGANIMVCENMMFAGDTIVFRRHTGELMHSDLRDKIIQATPAIAKTFLSLADDKSLMQEFSVDTKMADHVLMELRFRRDILGTRQFTSAVNNWHVPEFNEFRPRTMWSLYNACNAPMKGTGADKIMGDHRELHRFIMSVVEPGREIVLS